MNTTLTDRIVDGYREALHVRPTRTGDLVVLPQTFANGRALAIEVRRLDGDTFEVSDRGLTADVLDESGVDLSNDSPARSWAEILRDVSNPPVMHPGHSYELARQVSALELALGINLVASAMLRAEGLRVLAPGYRPISFSDQIVHRLANTGRGLTVVTNARVHGRNGTSSRVTAKLESARGEAYLQALSATSSETRSRGYQRSYTVFATAQLDPWQKVIALENMDSWGSGQISDLRDVANVFDGDRVEQIVEHLTAA